MSGCCRTRVVPFLSFETSTTFMREMSDSVAVTDSIAETFTGVFPREFSDSVGVSDSMIIVLTGGGLVLTIFSDEASVADGLSRAAEFSRSSSDSATVTDSIAASLFVTLGDSTSSFGGGNESVAKPAGVVDGTVLVACVGHNASPITVPTGFVKQGSTASFDAAFAGFNWDTDLYIKVVTNAAGEPASYSFTGGVFTDIWMVAVQNVDNATPVPAGGKTERPVSPATGTTANGASCTVAREGSLLLRFEASNSENRATGPAGMTALPGSPIDTTFNADYEDDLNVGSTGDKNSTYTNTQTWTVHMIVLQPLP